MKDNDVVITGMGVVSSLGNSLDQFETNIFSGVSGAGIIERFDTAELPTKIGCEVKGYNSEFRDIKISFALDAAKEAISMSGVSNDDLVNLNSQLSIGIGLELFAMDDLIAFQNGLRNDELHFLNTPSDLCCHLISKKYSLNNSPLIHISACAAGNDAIGSAFLQINRGHMDLVLCGGTDSMINPMGIAGFSRIGAMTLKNETPLSASMPFNINRDGFVIGEGAGFLVLESYKSACKRKAKILGQISGQGNSLDAYSISDPHPKGLGAVKAMNRAIESAGLTSLDISAVSAHATGTAKNDPAETIAIQTVFQENLDVPVFATKSMIGHTISAAGAIETIVAVLSLNRNELHRTLNLTAEAIDPTCKLNHILDTNLKLELKHILKNSFGFGGQNACLVISKIEKGSYA